MLDKQTIHDLELGELSNSLSLQTSWGKSAFYDGLLNPSAHVSTIKKKQLPLLALKNEHATLHSIQSALSSLKPEIVDDCLAVQDSRIVESVSQVLWKPESMGAFLNQSPLLLKFMITWKTLILPGFAVLMPLIAIVVPFFVLKYTNPGQTIQSAEYLERLKVVLLQQITIPSFIKSRGPNDRFGFLMESLFIGLTLAMFVSSLWNQITASLNLRHVWDGIDERGAELKKTVETAQSIVDQLRGLPLRKTKALKYVIADGERAIDACRHLHSLSNVSLFGTVWNDTSCMVGLKQWLAHVDVLASIAVLPSICIPKAVTGPAVLNIDNLVHPMCESCISNNLRTTGHSILTGPNRGGKSTFCKAIGLAVVTAQSWGFAWASRMTWSPFASILTALEPYGKVGEYSTFEAEIDFAKSVLAVRDAPCFVMMDEIFHSTNANDGYAASSVFLKQLYAKPATLSIISTHYKQLAESFRDSAQSLCLVASEREDGRLDYTYKVAHGISDKSSVMEILYERGLLCTPGKSAV